MPPGSGIGYRRQRGFSLAELMVAVAIGMLLTAGMIYVLVINKGTYREAERTARMQENARFALDYLAHDLRLAGFWGEARGADVVLDGALGSVAGDCSGAAAAFAVTDLLWGGSAASGQAAGCVDDALTVDGIPSDVLAVKYVRPRPLTDADGDGDLDAGDGLLAQRPYLVANPQTARLSLAESAQSFASLPSVAGGGAVPDGRAWEYRSHLYYVRANGSAAPTLARKRLLWDAGEAGLALESEDLVEGVEGLRILYGSDSDGNGQADTFTPASDVGDWNRVIAARIHLLIRSPEPDGRFSDEKRYQLGDATVTATAGDAASQGARLRNFHRLVVSTTVTLRNPQLGALGRL